MLFVLGLITYFKVSFSDPGYLSDDIKITLDEQTIRTLEEVKYFIKIRE
jgi:hypothetical protein